MNASVPSNTRLPLTQLSTGVRLMRPVCSDRRSNTKSTMPPASARKLIQSGRLKPCHTARSNSGSCPPTTGVAAVDRMSWMDHCGSTPTSRQASTSSSTGTRIQCGGSCGVRGSA